MPSESPTRPTTMATVSTAAQRVEGRTRDGRRMVMLGMVPRRGGGRSMPGERTRPPWPVGATAGPADGATGPLSCRSMGLRCFLGHGASGTAASMTPFVEGLRARGFVADAIELPRRKAEDALPAFHEQVPAAADVVVGGHSFGGRVASLAAAEPGAPYAALICSLPAPSARPAGADRGPHRALAGHPMPGPAALGRVRPVRPDRAVANGRGPPRRRGAGDLSAAGARPEAGARRRPRPRGAVPERVAG